MSRTAYMRHLPDPDYPGHHLWAGCDRNGNQCAPCSTEYEDACRNALDWGFDRIVDWMNPPKDAEQ